MVNSVIAAAFLSKALNMVLVLSAITIDSRSLNNPISTQGHHLGYRLR